MAPVSSSMMARYCLWLADAETGDVRANAVLRRRVGGVRALKVESGAASTREAASYPHLFRQIAQPSTSYLCIPAHTRRRDTLPHCSVRARSTRSL